MKLTKHATTNYKKLLPFIEATENSGGAARFYSGEYMPLVIEKLYYNDYKGRPVYSIAHYGRQNGDAMRDPDITFSIDPAGAVIPLTYQNDYFGLYQEVFIQRDNQMLYSRKLMISLDQFISQWLDNIKDQGFTPAEFQSIA